MCLLLIALTPVDKDNNGTRGDLRPVSMAGGSSDGRKRIAALMAAILLFARA
ncbi:MAG TPA: hypothetical protein VE986_10030 [Hyphomicrobiales bacterium]|nr:hypothetical protein [Hyphomicrobiales bacterium]